MNSQTPPQILRELVDVAARAARRACTYTGWDHPDAMAILEVCEEYARTGILPEKAVVVELWLTLRKRMGCIEDKAKDAANCAVWEAIEPICTYYDWDRFKVSISGCCCALRWCLKIKGLDDGAQQIEDIRAILSDPSLVLPFVHTEKKRRRRTHRKAQTQTQVQILRRPRVRPQIKTQAHAVEVVS